MKVLVANPPWPGTGFGARSDVRWPHKRKDKFLEYPIYLSYVVALLDREGIDVVFIDAVYQELSVKAFADEVKKHGPGMVVLECSTPSIDHDLETAGQVKKSMPGVLTVLVGSHATVFHHDMMEDHPEIDVICRGEFDMTVLDLAKSGGSPDALRGIPGITYRKGGDIIANEDRALIEDLDALPFPARHIIKTDDYRQGTFSGAKSTTMITSRGCPYQCTFCLWPRTLYGHSYRKRSVKNVVDEIEHVVRDLGVDEIYFDDDCWALDKKRAIEICRDIRARRLRIRWIVQIRADALSAELLSEMKKSGCCYLRIGVESGSQRMLDVMKKSTDLRAVEEAFRMARSAGIKTQAFFLLGLPGENDESVDETIRFAKMIKPDSAQFAIAIPHPGTELYDECMKHGWLRFNGWEDFSSTRCLIETGSFSGKQIEEARIKAYRRFYYRPSFVAKTLFGIKSFGEARSVWKSARSIGERLNFFKKSAGASQDK
jgi:radical SAM superfamily enzyme YgiQ (UPF0313 family)